MNTLKIGVALQAAVDDAAAARDYAAAAAFAGLRDLWDSLPEPRSPLEARAVVRALEAGAAAVAALTGRDIGAALREAAAE